MCGTCMLSRHSAVNVDDSLPSVGGSIADTPDARRIRDDMRDADELAVFQR